MHDDTVKAAGLNYDDFGKKYPLLKARFDANGKGTLEPAELAALKAAIRERIASAADAETGAE